LRPVTHSAHRRRAKGSGVFFRPVSQRHQPQVPGRKKTPDPLSRSFTLSPLHLVTLSPLHPTGTHSSPKVSATAAFVTLPRWMLTPSARPLFSATARSK